MFMHGRAIDEDRRAHKTVTGNESAKIVQAGRMISKTVRHIRNNLQSFAEVGRIGSHVVLDHLISSPPRRSDDIPLAMSSITVEWLTNVLCAKIPGAKVVSFQVLGGSDGTTSRRAIKVQYNAAGDSAGLPMELFGKTTPGLKTRLICGPCGGLANEVNFYRNLRSQLDITAPQAHFAQYDRKSYRSCLMFDDMSRTANFCNPKLPISLLDAQNMISLLAKVHATFWEDRRLEENFTWLQTASQFQAKLNTVIDYEARSYVGVERARDVMHAAALSKLDRLWPAFTRSLELNAETPPTLLHHDVHIGNWYRTTCNQMGLCDWQCTVKGGWAGDIAYALSSALTIQDRRAWERDLIGYYLDRLSAFGVANVPTADVAWLQYRQQMFHPFFFWVFTIGAGELQPAMQRDEFSLLNIQRMSAALTDLDSLTALGSP